ncbi:hypothetical protein KUCAC02_010492 [Chaenocephalus aceratus]|uniref:Uncharacterized protein n=1 Tax=Chaenocephalus aceratus TaxID=36190 RepID=A0ACB9W003_CHAAC|nr:hypothetical protein KUCAC02_010492 [Chaenocephalus aceratus]
MSKEMTPTAAEHPPHRSLWVAPLKSQCSRLNDGSTAFSTSPYSLVNISNNFIQHFGEREHLQLYSLMEKGVVIEELFEGGHARISVMGSSSEDAVVAGIQVEAMLCNVQKEFVKDEQDAMCEALGEKRVDFERKKVDTSSNRLSAFKKEGLWIVKVDKVVNPSLKIIYDQKATQLCCSTQNMLQLIPAQFCEMVLQNWIPCRVRTTWRGSVRRGDLLCGNGEEGHGGLEGASKGGVSVLRGSRGADGNIDPWDTWPHPASSNERRSSSSARQRERRT